MRFQNFCVTHHSTTVLNHMGCVCAMRSLGNPIEKGFQDVLSRFIEIESRSLARVLLAISTDLVEDVCTMQAIKSSTHEPEMFQASKLCEMSMLYAIFHRHSDTPAIWCRFRILLSASYSWEIEVHHVSLLHLNYCHSATIGGGGTSRGLAVYTALHRARYF
eukprot:SAG31_NODE_20113_length_583_cov_1.194215_1_plen_162_part_00